MCGERFPFLEQGDRLVSFSMRDIPSFINVGQWALESGIKGGGTGRSAILSFPLVKANASLDGSLSKFSITISVNIGALGFALDVCDRGSWSDLVSGDWLDVGN